MAEDSGSPAPFAPPAALYRAGVGLLLGAVVFGIAIVLDYASEPGHLHGAAWLGFLLGLVLAAVLAGFVIIQVRLRRDRQRRSARGMWLALGALAVLFVAGALSPSANTTYGGALLVAGFGICLGFGVAAIRVARRSVDEG